MKIIWNSILLLSTFIGNIGFYIGGAIIHLWSVYILYVFHGIIGGIVGLFTPGISQLYLIFQFTINIGFINEYSIAIILFFIVVFVGSPFGVILALKQLEKIEVRN